MIESRRRPSPAADATLLARRARAWALGRGLFSVHVGAYLLGATGLVLLNLLRSPTDLWFWDVLRGWGVVLAIHAAVVVALAATRGLTADVDERPTASQAAPTHARPRPSTGPAFDPAALTRQVGVVAAAARGVATAVTAEGRRARARWLGSRPAGAAAGAYAGWGQAAEPRASSFRSRVRQRVGPLDRLPARVVAWMTSPAWSFGWTARPRTGPTGNAHTAPSGRFAAGFHVTEPSPSMPAATAAAWQRDEPLAEPAAHDPLPVPTLFLLRREEPTDAESTAAWPRADRAGTGHLAPRVLPTGEDIVLAGPSPLDAGDANLDWTWMEAAAAAWLAQREADVPGAAPPAPPADHDAGATSPPPSAQRAGAG